MSRTSFFLTQAAALTLLLTLTGCGGGLAEGIPDNLPAEPPVHQSTAAMKPLMEKRAQGRALSRVPYGGRPTSRQTARR